MKWLVEQNGYEEGTNDDYNDEYAIDETRLFQFLNATQPDEMEKLGVNRSESKKRQFLNRLSGEIGKRGVIHVLRNGIKVYPAKLILFYFTPTEKNDQSKLFEQNIFSVTRQLHYSLDMTKLALGNVPVHQWPASHHARAQNHFTGQTTADAVETIAI